MTPSWLLHALTRNGTQEVPGPGFNPWIKSMWMSLRGGRWYWNAHGQDDSSLPWCGGFCAWAFQEVNIAFPVRYASALAWLEWGVPCGPELGAVAVIRRKGGGHVAFVTGVSSGGGYVRLYGGNQDNSVSDKWFSAERIAGYRKPTGITLTAAAILPVGLLSTTQA